MILLNWSAIEAAFAALYLDYFDWVDETFPGETEEEQVEHLKEEFQELITNRKDPGEYADVFMLLLCVARQNGVDLLKAYREKMKVNRSRSWAKTEKGFRHT